MKVTSCILVLKSAKKLVRKKDKRIKEMHRMQFDHLHLELLSLIIDQTCLTICHRRLMQNTVLEQECFDR